MVLLTEASSGIVEVEPSVTGKFCRKNAPALISSGFVTYETVWLSTEDADSDETVETCEAGTDDDTNDVFAQPATDMTAIKKITIIFFKVIPPWWYVNTTLSHETNNVNLVSGKRYICKSEDTLMSFNECMAI